MKKIAFWVGALALPLTTFAQLENVENITNSVGDIVNIVIPIVFALAVLGFFYGLVRYIFAGEHDKEAAKKTMLWGIIALFVMATVWGLVNWLGNAVGIDPTSAPDVRNLIPN